MNYIKITPIDVANGPGCRTVLWTAGCEHHCKECHNPETWSEKAGILFDENAMQELLTCVGKNFIQGVTLSGGDPMHPNNREKITEIVKQLKAAYPQKDIWMYTGYLYEDIKDMELMQYIDVLVDGPFILEQKDITLLFRGSKNQRLILVEPSRRLNTIVLYQPKI